MKTLKILTLGFAFAGLTFSASAQLNEIDFIKGGLDDAQILFKEYLTPYGNAFGANLNAGWYNTAKPHKPLGFDVTITFNTAWAPATAKNFDMSLLGLAGTVSPGNTIAPTVAGKSSDRPDMVYSVDHPVNAGEKITVASYTMPDGTGVSVVPLPMAQLGIGLPLGTDISVRYLPRLDFGNIGSIGLWGVGIKHSILQHIPVLSRIPVIDASIQGGYTKLNTFANLEYTPADITGTDLTAPDPFKWKNQKIGLGIDAWTVNLVISQTLPIITFYQAIGYASSNANIYMEGLYPFPSVETTPGPTLGDVVIKDENNLKDPLDVEIQNNKDLRLNAGFRITLGVLTIHADYTKANYSSVTAGVGISFR